MVFDLCTSSGHALYFYQVLWNYLERYQSYWADTISIPKISKGNNSAKNVAGVTFVYLCTSSDHALHLYQVSWNYLKRYQSYGPDTNVQPLRDGQTDGRTDGRTDTQKFGGYNIIPRHFLWRGIKTKKKKQLKGAFPECGLLRIAKTWWSFGYPECNRVMGRICKFFPLRTDWPQSPSPPTERKQIKGKMAEMFSHKCKGSSDAFQTSLVRQI